MNQADGAVSSTSSGHFTVSILHAARAIEDRIESALGEVGLSMAKHSALTKLEEAGRPVTLSELAEMLSCVRSNITQLVDRLESDGFVRRVADPSDRRSVRAELTDLGRSKQSEGLVELAKVQQEISDKIGSADLSHLESTLQSIT